MRRWTTRFLFVCGCLLVAALIALGARFGLDQPIDRHHRPFVAEPRTVGKTPDGGTEQTVGSGEGERERAR